jgi:hypothetical protein
VAKSVSRRKVSEFLCGPQRDRKLKSSRTAPKPHQGSMRPRTNRRASETSSSCLAFLQTPAQKRAPWMPGMGGNHKAPSTCSKTGASTQYPDDSTSAHNHP